MTIKTSGSNGDGVNGGLKYLMKSLAWIVPLGLYAMHASNVQTEAMNEIKHLNENQKVMQVEVKEIKSAVDKLSVNVELHAAQCLKASKR